MVDTEYTYGMPNAGNNSAGKVTKVVDETGSIEYTYGKLGEVIEETRTIKHLSGFINAKERSATMNYESDYLGRMQSITYPDGEVVNYGYDYGGQVISVVGEYAGSTTEYVQNIGYDEYSQRVYIQYGNGTETNYVYDEERRWLANIQTNRTDGSGTVYQNMDYEFDLVGNVSGYTNDTKYYETSQSYQYDDLYQLTRVDGKSISRKYVIQNDYTATYSQTYTFDALGMGNMMNKNSTSAVSPYEILGDELNYELDYEYDENYAHRVSRIGTRYYQYDENGNVILERDGVIEENEVLDSQPILDKGDGVSGSEYGWATKKSDSNVGQKVYERSYLWDERNLLKKSSDNITVQYSYGSDGQRARLPQEGTRH